MAKPGILKEFNKFIHSSIWNLFHINKRVMIVTLCFVIITSVVAACFEGASFSFILLAFSTLSNDGKITAFQNSISSFQWLSNFYNSLTPNEIFSLFMMIAVGAQILRSGFSYVSRIAATSLSISFQSNAQRAIYSQITKFSFACVSQYKIGDLLHYINLPATLTSVLIDTLSVNIVSIATVFVLSFMMLMISPPLTFTVIILFALAAYFQKRIIKKVSQESQKLCDNSVNFNKHISQDLQGLRAIYSFNRQAESNRKMSLIIDQIATLTKKLAKWTGLLAPINEVMGISLIGTIIIISPFFLTGHPSDVLPVLLTFITLAYRVATRMQLFMSGLGTIAYHFGSLLRLEDILSPEGKEFTPDNGEIFETFKESITLENVCLHYPTKTKPAVNNLSITIPCGQTIAIVGASGAGKSSITDLLLRLYEPTAGTIYVDGKALPTYNVGSWRDHLGIVSQESIIFNETIEENIRFGYNSKATDHLVKTATIAGAHSFISKLPNSYQTIVGERGYKLSGGEKQRLSLARALLKNPKLLILDEATSNLDSHSEKLIKDSLEKLHGNITMIIIAHRLSTITNADQILVLDQGELIEQGSHSELLKLNGKYAKLWSLQTEKNTSHCP